MREPSERLAGPGRQLYIAGVLALTEPGPAAAGIVVHDERGRMLAHRSWFLGQSTRAEAEQQAAVGAARLAVEGAMEAPVFRLESAELVRALANPSSLPDGAPLTPPLRELLAQLPSFRAERVAPLANPARPVALAPLVDWLPERARKAEDLRVRTLGDSNYEVESASQPGQVYHVTLPRDGVAPTEQAPRCECADFEYRGIPCKHLIAAAREAGRLEHLFYRAAGSSTT
jgi:hypothetical protein